MMTVKIHISEWLGKKKMTQRELAERTGIRAATISALYHEKIKRIDVEHIAKLCEVFECQPGDLITYTKEEK